MALFERSDHCIAVGAIAALVFLTTGCYTSHVRTSYKDAGDLQVPQAFEAAPAFTYEKSDVAFTNYSMTPLGFSWMRRQVWEFLEAGLLE